jgi:hypothetical protein
MSKNIVQTQIDIAKTKYDSMRLGVITQCKERLTNIALKQRELEDEADRIERYLQDLNINPPR